MHKKTGSRATAAIKQQRQLKTMVNPKIVCYCHSSCLDLPVVLVGFHMKGCESRLHHVFQGGYVAMHEINLDGAEQSESFFTIVLTSFGWEASLRN